MRLSSWGETIETGIEYSLGFLDGLDESLETAKAIQAALRLFQDIIGIDKWYPSSKKCSACGFTMKKLALSTREWVCPECGIAHDRDINAARNILTAGLAVSALGESVSPSQAYA